MPDVHQDKKSLSQQIIDFLSNKNNKVLTEQLDVLKFGELKFEVKDGQVTRAFVSSSVIIKKGENNATQ